jgi:hypothetical protein
MENGITHVGLYLSPDQSPLLHHLPVDANLASSLEDAINNRHFSSPDGAPAEPPDKKGRGLAL